MRPTDKQIRSAYYFALALAGIAIVGNLAGQFMTGNGTVALLPFLGFFPVVIMFVVYSQRQTVEYIDALEARVRELEGTHVADLA